MEDDLELLDINDINELASTPVKQELTKLRPWVTVVSLVLGLIAFFFVCILVFIFWELYSHRFYRHFSPNDQVIATFSLVCITVGSFIGLVTAYYHYRYAKNIETYLIADLDFKQVAKSSALSWQGIALIFFFIGLLLLGFVFFELYFYSHRYF